MEYLPSVEMAALLAELGYPIEPNSLSALASRHKDDFPEGRRVGHSWTWPADDIVAWCRRTGRLPTEEGRIYDWQAYDVTDEYRRRK